MANIKSQIKRNKQNEKARLRNKATRSELATRKKKAVAAADAGEAEAPEMHRLAIKKIDRAVAKGILHKNTGARQKSRLAKRIAASASAE